MRKQLQITRSAAVMSLLTLTAFPQETPGVKNRRAEITQDHSERTLRAEEQSRTAKASDLIGNQVKNFQGEKVGKVDNLMVDLATGRVVAVIISSGGFLGLGDELSAVPPAALQFDTKGDALVLDISKEDLSNAPHFKPDRWPDFGQTNYTTNGAHRVESHSQTNFVSGADNTARNVRDRDDRSVTPLDQSNSATDTQITARIRKEIMAAKDLSVNAHNVKIITRDGRVTLRGPVESSEEKGAIQEIAQRVASSGNVDNQIEVK